MDKEVLQMKLEALIHCVHRIKSQEITSVDELESNIDKQEIIILNLQRAVQICVDIGNHILLDYETPTPSTMSETFKYLADASGITSVIMQGTATNSQGKTEQHAWNAVEINNSWYLIDATWDDPIIVGRGIVLASTHYKYFLKGQNVFNKDHILNKQFTENGKVFDFPNISLQDY